MNPLAREQGIRDTIQKAIACKAAAEHPEVVSEKPGHSPVRLTMNTYTQHLRMLGRSNTRMVSRYAHPADAHQVNALRKMQEREDQNKPARNDT